MGFRAHMSIVDRAAGHVLGETVQYTPSGGETISVAGVFDRSATVAQLQDPGVTTARPMLFVRADQLPGDPDVDDPRIVAGGVSYRLAEPARLDGAGGVMLILHEVV